METTYGEAIDLKLWYLKLARGLKTVRVAGFRALDENNLQKYISSPIVGRESAVCVFSKNHAYRLLGSMDEEAAEMDGFPRELVSFFRNGFPVNWEELLVEYFEEASFDKSQWAPDGETAQRTVIGSRVRSSYGQHYATFADNTATAPRRSILRKSLLATVIDNDEPLSKSVKRKSVQIVAPIEDREEERIERGRDQGRTDETTRTPKTISSNTPTALSNCPKVAAILDRAQKQPVIELNFWMFIFVAEKTTPTIHLKGHAYDEEAREWTPVQTTEIAHVDEEDRKIVYTKNASRYKLAVMDDVDNYGLPKWVDETFAQGFPNNWKQQLLGIYYDFVPAADIEKELSGKREDDTLKKRRSLRLSFPDTAEHANSKTNMKQKKNEEEPPETSDDEEELMRAARRVERRMRKEKKRKKMMKKRLSMVPEQDPNEDTQTDKDDALFKRPFAMNPVNRKRTISPQVARKAIIPGITRTEDLKTTRSGRLVHSPLAQWAGEYKIFDKDGNLIGVDGIITQTQMTISRKSGADAASIGQFYGCAASPLRKTKQAQKFLQRPEEEPKVIRKKTVKRREEEFDDSMYTNEEDSCIEHLKAEFGYSASPVTPGGPLRKRAFNTQICSDESEESDYEPEKPKKKKRSSEKRIKDPNDPVFIAKQRETLMNNITQTELHRFKLGLKMNNPTSDREWQALAIKLKPKLDIDAWKKLAETRLNWKPKVEEKTRDASAASSRITARQGTIAYQLQADKFTRDYVRTGGNDDYFEANKENTSLDEETTNVFDADDSIIELMTTPNPPPAKGKNGKGKTGSKGSQLALRKRNATRGRDNGLMDLIEQEEETGVTGGPRASFTPTIDSTKRENNQRYISHLRNQSTINSSNSFFYGKY
ncbi:unnamed protein product, partial [Mesorhabditis belari]|uniref:SANTA domain-containing protein n=1 Tax=Mesorhabditis belari TaxID=2138241 RepID=A0AAF3EQC0_9BILA